MSQIPTQADREHEHGLEADCFAHGCGPAQFEVTMAGMNCFSGVACAAHLGDLLGNVAKVMTRTKGEVVLKVVKV